MLRAQRNEELVRIHCHIQMIVVVLLERPPAPPSDGVTFPRQLGNALHFWFDVQDQNTTGLYIAVPSNLSRDR